MATTTVNMGLKAWDSLSDFFVHTELSNNWVAVDTHDHTTGKGVQLPEGALAADSITSTNLKDGSVTGDKLQDESIGAGKLESNAVDTGNIVDGAVTLAKMANNSIGTDQLTSDLLEEVGVSTAGTARRGKFKLVTSESRGLSSYGLMTTPDRVQNIVVPTDATLKILYRATWHKVTPANSTASAAIFLTDANGTRQLRKYDTPSPTVQEVTIDDQQSGTASLVRPLFTTSNGLASMDVTASGGSYDPTLPGPTGGQTGQIWHPVNVFVPAGTYDVSVRFKADGSTVSASNRVLYVWIEGF